MQPRALTNIAGFVVLLVWVATSVNGILTRDYQGLTIVTPVMLILAGYLFARDFFISKRKDDQ